MTATGGTVLVVDDNLEFLEVVRSVVDDMGLGLAVRFATTGFEAIRLLETEPCPAFLVLDFHLPDIDAPEVLRRIRTSEPLGSLPVLVLSQADWETDRRQAFAAGAQAFRVKPSRVHALREILLELWGDHGRAS